MAQLRKNTKELYFWDLLTCGKKSIVQKHKIRMPTSDMLPLSDIVWTSENAMFLVDIQGNVFMVQYNFVM